MFAHAGWLEKCLYDSLVMSFPQPQHMAW
jgi:hypothetical protein